MPSQRLKEKMCRHDAGTYTCLATNTIGESMGKDVDIDVQCE